MTTIDVKSILYRALHELQHQEWKWGDSERYVAL